MAQAGTIVNLPLLFRHNGRQWRMTVNAAGQLVTQTFNGVEWVTVMWVNENGELHPEGGVV